MYVNIYIYYVHTDYHATTYNEFNKLKSTIYQKYGWLNLPRLKLLVSAPQN